MNDRDRYILEHIIQYCDESMNFQLVWRTALTRIPELKASCETLLSISKK